MYIIITYSTYVQLYITITSLKALITVTNSSIHYNNKLNLIRCGGLENLSGAGGGASKAPPTILRYF